MEAENEVFTSFDHDAIGIRRALSFGNQVDDDLDSGYLSRGSMHRLFEMFVSYRILDLIALVQSIPCLYSFPRQIKLPNLGHIEKNVCYNDHDLPTFDF